MSTRYMIPDKIPDRVGSRHPTTTTYTAEARYGYLVGLALALDCHYAPDRCDDHRGEEGFTRCQPCVTRDEAESVVR